MKGSVQLGGILQAFFTLNVAITLLSAAPAWGAPSPFITINPDELYEKNKTDSGALECILSGDKRISGTFVPPDKFRPATQRLKSIKRKRKSALNLGLQQKAAKLRKKLKTQKRLIQADDQLCSEGPDTTPSEPLPTLDPLTRALTAEDVRYLAEKAGFGFGPREEHLVSIGLNQGIDALVSAFMSQNPEDEGVAQMTDDWRDGDLGETTQEAPYGQRAALLYLWSHTNNPYAERLAKFLLSVWTVSGDVVSDETFRFLFWDYFNRLRTYAASETDLPSLGVEITRDPLMLIYLNNELNVRWSPNENYARELMELFTLGPTDLDGTPNYTETTLDGLGDISVAAKMLTGWSNEYEYVPPQVTSRFLDSWHEPGPHVMFAGTPHAFSGENDEDLVRGIFEHHPHVKFFYAREILKEYLTPNPPRELIEAFAGVIANNNYRLRPAMAALFKSEAFYSETYKNTVPKDSAEFSIELIRTLRLEDAVNFGELQWRLDLAGFNVNNAPSVFWYPQGIWTSPSVLIEKANILHSIFSDETSQALAEPDWSPALIFPSGTQEAPAIIKHVAALLGVSTVSPSQEEDLTLYMHRSRQYDGTFLDAPYDNTDAFKQRTKGLGLVYILAFSPEFQLR